MKRQFTQKESLRAQSSRQDSEREVKVGEYLVVVVVKASHDRLLSLKGLERRLNQVNREKLVILHKGVETVKPLRSGHLTNLGEEQ